jgi:hypothetical protein
MFKGIALSAVAALCLNATAASAEQAAGERLLVIAQGGFTFGSRDDLGPRYDAYSERWDQYKPTSPTVCRWVSVRALQPDGKVKVERQHVCGFKVPARD